MRDLERGFAIKIKTKALTPKPSFSRFLKCPLLPVMLCTVSGCCL